MFVDAFFEVSLIIEDIVSKNTYPHASMHTHGAIMAVNTIFISAFMFLTFAGLMVLIFLYHRFEFKRKWIYILSFFFAFSVQSMNRVL